MTERYPPCHLCGSSEARLRYGHTADPTSRIPPAEFACTSPYLSVYDDIVECPHCGLVYSVPSLSPTAILDNYETVQDPTYLQEEAHRRTAFAESLDIIEQFVHPGRLVEVGSHIGLFLDVACRRGWQVMGVEPSRWAVDVGRQRFGVDLRQGDLRSLQLPGASVDAVAMWDVLEHFSDPLGELREAYRVTKPNGIVALTTVNISSIHARVARSRWPWLMRMHLFYFTPATLRTMIEVAGFGVERLETQRRVFTLSYLSHRFGQQFRLARGLSRVVETAHLGNINVPVDLGDILFAIGRAGNARDIRG